MGYDSLGQVIKADSTIPTQSRAYQYDAIGNRLKSAEGTTDPEDTTAKLYTPNALNQYSQITNNSITNNPAFDADGNMTSGPLPANVNANSTLIWDGENRLIEAQVNGGGTVQFVYDAQSRRIAETVGNTTKITIYDGWNPIAEYQGSAGVPPALSKTYTWGIDLSGSMQGAGGVGGLLSVTDSTGTYYPTYDGNGNVSEYLDSAGAVVAHYEYDPFGRTTVATGSKAQDFSHRFSTKPLDPTTGLYYYGYRFYDPVTGRWPSRDPIEEQGGVNLYGFVGNNGFNYIDVLGGFPLKLPPSEDQQINPEDGGGDYHGSPADTKQNCFGAACNRNEWMQPNKGPNGGGDYPNTTPETFDKYANDEECSRVEVGPCPPKHREVLVYISKNPSPKSGVGSHDFHVVGRPSNSNTWNTKLGRNGKVDGITDPDKHAGAFYPSTVGGERRRYCCCP